MSKQSFIEQAEAAYDTGDLREAAFFYQRELAINPDSADTAKRLASIFHRQKEFNAAAKIYQEAIDRLEKHNIANRQMEQLSHLHQCLGETYLKLHRLDNAEEQFAKAKQSGAEEATLILKRGEIYYASKQYEKALAEFENHALLKPNSADSYIHKAEVYCCQRRYDLAADALRAAKALAPDEYWIEIALGNLADDQSDFNSELEHYQKAEELDPYQPGVKYSLGRAYSHLKEYEHARFQFARVLEQAPNDADALYGLALAESNLGNEREAIALLKSAIVINPMNISYHTALCKSQAEAGKWREAMRTAFQVRKLARKRIEKGGKAGQENHPAASTCP